jgi:hypothetical protein
MEVEMWVCLVDPGDRRHKCLYTIQMPQLQLSHYSLILLPATVAITMLKLASIRRSLSAKLISCGQLNRVSAGLLAS